MCSSGAPLIYIGWRGGEAAKGAPQVRGILLGRLPIRPPPFHIHLEGEGRRREEGRKGKAESLSFLSPFSSFLPPYFGLHGAHQPPRGWSVPFLAHETHVVAGGCLEPLPVTRYVSDTPRTPPMSEYHRPIYESLPLDHFETPHHVRDLIRASEQHSVTKSHNSYNTKSSSNVKRADPMGSRTM